MNRRTSSATATVVSLLQTQRSSSSSSSSSRGCHPRSAPKKVTAEHSEIRAKIAHTAAKIKQAEDIGDLQRRNRLQALLIEQLKNLMLL
jgi:hypothetical protein